jgi:hypothetical protein
MLQISPMCTRSPLHMRVPSPSHTCRLPPSHTLQIPEPNKHYGLTRLLQAPLDPAEGLVLQFEVTYANGHECGGSYLKLLTYDEVRASRLVQG